MAGGLAFGPAVESSTTQSESPGSGASIASRSSVLLTCALGGGNSGSGAWIPATHMGNLDCTAPSLGRGPGRVSAIAAGVGGV